MSQEQASTTPRASDAPPSTTNCPAIVTVIEATERSRGLNLGELFRYRDLLLLLIWRDISARYRQSVIGYGWAVVRPVVSMLIFTFVFGHVAKIDTGAVPYTLFAFTGLLPWLYFSGALGSCVGSVVSGGAMLRKVYFPKLVLPITGVAVGLAELFIQLLVLAVIMFVYSYPLTFNLLFFPIFILAAIGTALAVGLWLTALNVKYRDIGQAVPFLIQAWMWMSPVAYPSNAVPQKYLLLYSLNPMAGVIDGFRWSLLGTAPPNWAYVGISGSITLAMLVGGLRYFRKTEDTFADII